MALRTKRMFFLLLLALAALPRLAGAEKAPQTAAVRAQIVVEPVPGLRDDFMKGVDVSMVDQIEASGGKFYNPQGQEADVFTILKEHGVNYVRLRLWNNPRYPDDLHDQTGRLLAKKGERMGGGNNDLATDIRMAQRIKKAGLQFLLDFHYSDFWADPGKQYMPQDWKTLSPQALEEELERFTRETIDAFTAAGCRPDSVQIGNELNSGFLWPQGQLWSGDPSVKIGGMSHFIRLLERASRGVRTARDGKKIKIIIHLADGGKQDLYRWIFDEVEKAKIDYDIIGLSFYPYWHGPLSDLKANLEMLSKRYGKDMAVVETAYAFTEENGDSQVNVFQVYSDDRHGYVPSVQGQATAIRDIIATVGSVPGGCGVFYWEADAILWPGANLSSYEGNTWENQALFSFDGKALPSLAVWNLVSGRGAVSNVWGGSARNGGDFTPYALVDELTLTVQPGSAPALPEKVKLLFGDDSERLVAVTWETQDWSGEKGAATRVVQGQLSEPYSRSFVPTATVVVSDRCNLLSDPSFESGRMGSWRLQGPSEACLLANDRGNAHSGKWACKYWLSSGFQAVLSQELTDIPAGNYELSLWAMGGGGEKDIHLFAVDFDGSKKQLTAKITNNGWQEWKQYKILVPVSDGKVRVGVCLDTNPGCWGSFDDLEFIRVTGN